MRSMAMFLTSFLLAFMFCFVAITAQNLPDDEVESLKQIVNTLGKKDWNFEVRPCSEEWDRAYDFDFSDDLSTSAASVGCDCSFANNTVCHIASISFRRQNLSGSLPPELVRLPFLQVFDVAWNYLNGTIPPEWGSMKLVNIMLEFNQLSGTIPPELGNLPSIERLLLTSNNLTGELPENLSNLTTLKDFRIGDNNFVGSIPNFIQKWTNMNKLMIQGSGLSGPIPAGESVI